MSFSRKNWSALSSLARQWTMEDEEEAEREKRRRVKSSTADPDEDSSSAPRSTSSSDDSEMSQGPSSLEQMQLDFVEMLRARDEKRRIRLVETLRQQKEEEENDEEARDGAGGGDARVVVLGELDEVKDVVSKPKPPIKTSSYCPTTSSNNKARTSKHENGEPSHRNPDPDLKPATGSTRKFVSALSISLDHPSSPCGSSPTSPSRCSPVSPFSPREHRPSPCQSPSPRAAKSPVQNGHTLETSLNGSSTNGNFEQTSKPAFVRQSSRTLSFRMMKKKEEDQAPLQRSSSVRIASKKFESNTDQNEDVDKTSSFQRNSRQRISSRSIKEKMERLAQAAQKSEQMRSQDVTQRTLFLLEEVSRKRGIFEKEQPAQNLTSPGVSRKEFRSFTSGMSDRINRWLNKTDQTGLSLIPSDLRHVDITSKRSLFEKEESDSKSSPEKN